jgi:two-component system phosphate regulon sensor histidine kinase PhoR
MVLELTGDDLLNSLTSGALVVDGRGVIRYANPVFLQLSGFDAPDVLAHPLSEFLQLPPKTDCALCLGVGGSVESQWATFHGAFLRTAAGPGQAEVGELRIKIKHSPLPAASGKPGGVLCLIDPFSEDTTLTQAHSDFVSTVSHEFRTPLTSIKGFADTLLLYGAQLPEEEKRRFINIIKDQADRLIRLVENLLTVSKLGASRVEMSYRPIPLQRLLEKVTHSVQAKTQAKSPGTERKFDVEIRPDTLEIWADPDRLEQVLLNLVDNAVKYSPADSVVRIRAGYLPDDDGRIRILVQDQGAGIPQELMPRIFTKFYRVESPLKQEVEGTGLGLYITKSLTTAMGGEISAESKPDQGSTFTVIFPAATPERQATHRRTLYADDESETRSRLP